MVVELLSVSRMPLAEDSEDTGGGQAQSKVRRCPAPVARRLYFPLTSLTAPFNDARRSIAPLGILASKVTPSVGERMGDTARD